MDNRFDGTAARQLVLLDDENHAPLMWKEAPPRAPHSLRLLQKDIYAELNRRRRQAQIKARHLIEK